MEEEARAAITGGGGRGLIDEELSSCCCFCCFFSFFCLLRGEADGEVWRCGVGEEDGGAEVGVELSLLSPSPPRLFFFRPIEVRFFFRVSNTLLSLSLSLFLNQQRLGSTQENQLHAPLHMAVRGESEIGSGKAWMSRRKIGARELEDFDRSARRK